jgi:hypothetical protein
MNKSKKCPLGISEALDTVKEDMSKTIELVDRMAALEHSLIQHIVTVEHHIAALVEGDRNQLDVFIEEIKPQLQELKRDIKWLKSKWEKFST